MNEGDWRNAQPKLDRAREVVAEAFAVHDLIQAVKRLYALTGPGYRKATNAYALNVTQEMMLVRRIEELEQQCQ